MTPRQLEILQHALGVDQYGRGDMYRNHFCAGGEDEDVCRELVGMGLMRVWHPNASPLPYYNCTVTEEGKRVVREQSPKPPKLTPSQRRYRHWLDVADCFPDWSFGDWLKHGGVR